jgi:hypothetical protein
VDGKGYIGLGSGDGMVRAGVGWSASIGGDGNANNAKKGPGLGKCGQVNQREETT